MYFWLNVIAYLFEKYDVDDVGDIDVKKGTWVPSSSHASVDIGNHSCRSFQGLKDARRVILMVWVSDCWMSGSHGEGDRVVNLLPLSKGESMNY